MKPWLTVLFVVWSSLLPARITLAHDAPTSFFDLRTSAQGLDLVLTSSTTDLAHDLSFIEPDMLLQPAVLEQEKNALSSIVLSRLTIKAEGNPLHGELWRIEPLPEKRDLRLCF